jgi:hypothetical protein
LKKQINHDSEGTNKKLKNRPPINITYNNDFVNIREKQLMPANSLARAPQRLSKTIHYPKGNELAPAELYEHSSSICGPCHQLALPVAELMQHP